MQTYKLPVFDARDGRTVLGYAEGVRTATVLVRKLVNVPAGFKLEVWKRNETMCEILEAPEGFVYSIYR